MPVLLKNHTWNQDCDSVTVHVPFPENHLCSEDVFTSEQYLKINKAPYFWEALLLHPISEDDSRCVILENEVVFRLRKAQNDVEWITLERQISGREKVQLKEELLADHRKRLEERAKQRAIEKDQRKRDDISKQIEREANDRAEIDQLLKQAKQIELERMEEEREKRPKHKPPEQIKKPPAKVSTEKPRIESVPAIRRSGTVEVTFSERNYVTPKRESKEPDEIEWDRKLNEAKKAIGFVEDDLSPDKWNPIFLKGKGDQFFNQKNYLAAVSAYSTGIRLTNKLYSLFLNRAAAHFLLENYQRCAEDCSTALELLVPPVEANRKSRMRCLMRRGAALVKLGFKKQGYDELVAASKLDPQNNTLQQDIEMVQRMLEDDSDSEE